MFMYHALPGYMIRVLLNNLIAGAEQGPWALEPGEHINAVEQVGDVSTTFRYSRLVQVTWGTWGTGYD